MFSFASYTKLNITIEGYFPVATMPSSLGPFRNYKWQDFAQSVIIYKRQHSQHRYFYLFFSLVLALGLTTILGAHFQSWVDFFRYGIRAGRSNGPFAGRFFWGGGDERAGRA